MTHFVRKPILTGLSLLLLAAMWVLPAHAASSTNEKAAPTSRPLCVVHSNHSQVESGLSPLQESSIADIIIVACRPVYSKQTMTIDATQLFFQCHSKLLWFAPSLTAAGTGPQFTVTLDNDGNATAVVFGGPSCAAATTIIFASLNAPPFPTTSTTFTILPPMDTKPGVTAMPRREVEDAVFSSVATVIQVEFPSTQAERFVTFRSNGLFARCAPSSIFWFGPEGIPLAAGISSVTVQLDNNGNAFVVVIGDLFCASGTSTIMADLHTVPYTTFSTTFTTLSPRPTI
ncbi:MAG TPA: hypothetical protein VKY19_26110 [Ktedonosporobacter sp.]|jgi:hypothetical protein|nr:hypothetical protein [Ktedonosporobacter sp.]